MVQLPFCCVLVDVEAAACPNYCRMASCFVHYYVVYGRERTYVAEKLVEVGQWEGWDEGGEGVKVVSAVEGGSAWGALGRIELAVIVAHGCTCCPSATAMRSSSCM